MADAPDCTSWPSNTNDVITSNYPSGCYERRGQPPSLPTTETAWRQLDVTIDDVSSDSSDGGVDSPERSEFTFSSMIFIDTFSLPKFCQ